MYKYLLEHERWIMGLLKSEEDRDWRTVRDYHMAQIGFMQHERLIHLVVTLAFAFILLASIVVTMIYPVWQLLLIDIILTITETIYIIHYYRLENGVQRWYRIYQQICSRITDQ
jgi:hypothetical protein